MWSLTVMKLKNMGSLVRLRFWAVMGSIMDFTSHWVCTFMNKHEEVDYLRNSLRTPIWVLVLILSVVGKTIGWYRDDLNLKGELLLKIL